jgi:hypothetical protein
MSGALQNNDGSAKKWKHGATIVNGELRFTSVSALNRAEACLRSWWYRYRGKIPDPPASDMMRRGDECHQQVARYLTTGDRKHLQDTLILQGFHQLPTPGPDLLVEWDIVPDLPDGSSGLVNAKLRVAGIPVVGAIDLMHSRRENWGAQDPRDAVDEPGVLKIIDHKFTSDAKWAKTSADLPEELQMAGYAVWAFETFPGLERVRLQHNSFPIKGNPRAPSVLVERDDVQKTWERGAAIGVSIRDAARESNPDRVDANTKSCHLYGRDCPAIHVCRAAGTKRGVSALMGATAANRLIKKRLPLVNGEPNHVMTAPAPNSLMARLQSAAAGQTPAPTTAVPAIQSPVAPPPAASADVQAEVARLSQIEAQATGEAPPPAQTAPAPQVDPLVQVAQQIDAIGIGMPTLTGDAARAVAASFGHELTAGAGLGGGGMLGEYTASSLEELNNILAGARELIGVYGTPEKALEAYAQMKSEQGQSSTPTVEATAPLEPAQEVKTEEPKPEETKKKTSTKKASSKKSKAAEEAPAAQPETPVETKSESTVTAPAIVQNVTVEGTVVVAPETAKDATITNVTFQHSRGPTLQPPGAINIFVDCVVDGLETKSLWPLVIEIWNNMTADANAPDPRCADQNSSYGFGRWKGVLAACLREAPSLGHLPPGNYTLQGSMGDLGNVAAETLMQIAQATGGIFVKGAR